MPRICEDPLATKRAVYLSTLPSASTERPSPHWVYDLKTDADGNVERYKARFVARESLQIPGIDFYGTYAPVATEESTRILLHLGLSMGLEVRMLDFKTAFLNGNLEEEIYLEQANNNNCFVV